MSNVSSGDGDLLADMDQPVPLPSRLEILIPLLEEIPVQHALHETGRTPRLLARGAVLFVVALLAYLPCFWAGLDGERDWHPHLAPPEPAWHTPHQLAAWFELHDRIPNLVRILIYFQSTPDAPAPMYPMVSVSLHALATVLLWLVLRRLSQHAAFLAALLFAVHPANVPAVMWASQQGRLWAAVFSLIGVLLLLKNRSVPAELPPDHPEYFIEPPPWIPALQSIAILTGSMLAFIVAALCQPATMMVPLLAIVLIAWKKKPLRTDWMILFPLFVMGCVLAAVVAHASHAQLGLQSMHLHSKFTTTFLWPMGRIVCDVLLLHSPIAPWIDSSDLNINLVTGVAMTLILILIPTLALYKRIGPIPGIVLLAFIMLIPTVWAPMALHASAPGLQGITSPGEAYLCQIPFLVLFANLILKLTQHIKTELTKAKAQFALAVFVAVGLGLTTALYASDFASTERLLKSAVNAESGSAASRSRLAEFYIGKATPEGVKQAAKELKDVNLENCPDAFTAVAKGDCLAANGEIDAAVKWYQHAQDMDNQGTDATGHLATLYILLNRPTDAAVCYQQAIEKHPDDAALRNDYGRLLLLTGQLDQAIEQFTAIERVDPDYAPVHVNLANACFNQGKLEQGTAELQKAHALDPDNFDAYHSAGIILYQLHHYEDAIRELTFAAQLNPNSLDFRNDLGVALVDAGKINRAIFEFQQILAQHPDYESAKHNLDIARRRLADQKSQQMMSPAAVPAQ